MRGRSPFGQHPGKRGEELIKKGEEGGAMGHEEGVHHICDLPEVFLVVLALIRYVGMDVRTYVCMYVCVYVCMYVFLI